MKDEATKEQRNTKQKSLILELLKSNIEHITADEIYQKLADNNTLVPKATIYRTLSLLEKNNIIRKYSISDKLPACYQFIDGNKCCYEHYHFMCNVCLEVAHVSNRCLENSLSELKFLNGFEVDSSKTVFYGVCVKCKKTSDIF